MIKILIVDDSSIMRKMIVQTILKGNIFNHDNTRFFEASNGSQGVELFGIHRPQVVLTDWTMPQMDGIQMIEAIRKRDPDTPVVMITSEATEDRMKIAKKAGATDYIVKPLEPGVLEQKLLKAFEALRNKPQQPLRPEEPQA